MINLHDIPQERKNWGEWFKENPILNTTMWGNNRIYTIPYNVVVPSRAWYTFELIEDSLGTETVWTDVTTDLD